MLAPRPYQAEAIDASLTALWGPRQLHSVAGVLPTGSGKTVVFCGVGGRYTTEVEPGKRVLVLAHRTELVEQAADEFRSVIPGATVGIVQANRNETLAQFVVASVQTLAGRSGEQRMRMIRDVGLIIVDECHHAAAKSYRAVAGFYGVGERGGAKQLGVTATLSRGDGLALGEVFQDVVFESTIAEMVRDGWLVRPRGLRVWVDDLDLSRVRRSRGDYSEGDLGRAIEESQTPEAVARALQEHAPCDPTIVFAPTVASAEAIRAAVEAAGFTTGLVHGEMPRRDRAAVLDDFRAGRVQVLCNCMVLTEGTNLPLATVCVIARPTTHHGLYIQMAGRVLRPHPGKTGALILDVVGASQKHSLQAHVELFGEDALPDDETPKAKRKGDELDDDELTTLDDMLAGDGLDRSHYGVANIITEEVDLFHSSQNSWQRTKGGAWFLDAGTRYIVVHPTVRSTPGTWDVSSVEAYRAGPDAARWVVEGVPDLAYARGWGEDEMTKKERALLTRDAKWRLRVPDVKLRTAASQWGIVVVPGMTAGEVSAQITVAMASRRLDAAFARLGGSS